MQGPSAAAIASRLRAEPLHRGDGRLDDPGQRALPAGVGGADDARLRVGEQDHAAVGAGDAERQARRRGDDPVAARPRVRRPVLGDRDRVGRMDLIGHREALRRDAERGRHPRAVLRHRLGRVARADAAVERSVDAFGDAAPRVKKACATPGSRSARAVRNGQRSRRLAALGWKPGGGGSLRLATRHRLEQRAHLALALADEAVAGVLQLLRPLRVRRARRAPWS